MLINSGILAYGASIWTHVSQHLQKKNLCNPKSNTKPNKQRHHPQYAVRRPPETIYQKAKRQILNHGAEAHRPG